jgi:hypothetical protein
VAVSQPRPSEDAVDHNTQVRDGLATPISSGDTSAEVQKAAILASAERDRFDVTARSFSASACGGRSSGRLAESRRHHRTHQQIPHRRSACSPRQMRAKASLYQRRGDAAIPPRGPCSARPVQDARGEFGN